MRSTRFLALLLAFSLPAAAQDDLTDEVARLDAENAVLRHELRALRSRLDSLEQLVRERLGAEPWTGAASRPREEAPPPPLRQARVADDRSDVQIADLRLPDDAGAPNIQELARELHAGLLALSGSETACRELLGRLAAFEPGPGRAFLVPPEAWRMIRPEGAPESPRADELEVAFHTLVMPAPGLLAGSRLAGLEPLASVAGAPRAALLLELSSGAPVARLRLELSAVRVNGRLLAVAITAPWFQENAQAALLALRDVLGTTPRPGTARVLPALEAITRRGVVATKRADDQNLTLPFYVVHLRGLAGGEWGAVAMPIGGPSAELIIGPFPGEHDPRENPYKVRVRKIPTPITFQVGHGVAAPVPEPVGPAASQGGYLGVVTVGAQGSDSFGNRVEVVRVESVHPDSPAAAGDVRAGDVILSLAVKGVGGTAAPSQVAQPEALRKLLAGLKPGTRIVLRLQRASDSTTTSTFNTQEIVLSSPPEAQSR